MENQTSPLFLLYSIAIVQLLLLLVIFYKKRHWQKSENILFLALIFSLTVIIGDFLLTWSGYMVFVPQLIGMSFPFPLLLGPILLGLLETEHNDVLSKKDRSFSILYLAHFIPFIIAVAYQSTFYAISSEAKLEVYENEIANETAFHSMVYILETIVITLHLLGYMAWCYLKVRKAKMFVSQINKSIGLVLSIVGILLLIHSLLLFFDLPFYALVYCILVALLGVLGFWLQWIFLFPATSKIESKKYKNSGLPDSILQKEGERILEKMSEQKPFLNSDLKLATLAKTLDLNPHHLSQIMNQEFGKNFADFVNEYRIKNAQELLRSESEKTIQEIAYASGFNSKNSFNRSFKKFVGFSPSEFRAKS